MTLVKYSKCIRGSHTSRFVRNLFTFPSRWRLSCLFMFSFRSYPFFLLSTFGFHTLSFKFSLCRHDSYSTTMGNLSSVPPYSVYPDVLLHIPSESCLRQVLLTRRFIASTLTDQTSGPALFLSVLVSWFLL